MRRDRPGMSTTLVTVAVGGGAAFLAHAGDSRAYLIRDGVMRQLTEDHSMVNEMVRSGRMSHEEARASKFRSVITRAVGQYPTVQADLMIVEILAGDRIVLCSDGLTDPVPLELIEEIAGRGELDAAGTALVQAALERGGPDNVSVILVEPEASGQSDAVRARAAVLERLFLFEGLPFHAQMRVSAICREVFFSPGEILVEQGDPGDSMYVIIQGQVKVERDGVLLAQLGRGQHFGEVSLVDQQPRSARVQCEAFGSAIIISRDQLQEFCRRDPALGNVLIWKLLQALGGRLRDANQLVTLSARGSNGESTADADTVPDAPIPTDD
jgi:CRP-like cAMP-binding protein